MHNADTIAILGGGSWGTAVAIHLARQHKVLLWGRGEIKDMIQNRVNEKYLPGIKFPKNLEPTHDFDKCIIEAQHIIIGVPSHAFKEVLDKLPENIQSLSWITKGIDYQSNQLLSVLVKEKYGENFPIAIISGPSFAKEVARFLPTLLVVASENKEFADRIRNLFHFDNIRVYLTDDIIGVQICGAVKNVLAIACGISDGLDYGANARAALITRGLAEMSRLGVAMGAKADTFMGLAGVGDLVLTCTDNQSRNRRFGLLLGQGTDIKTAIQHIGQVVEGQFNAKQVTTFASQYNVDMPISQTVHNLLLNKFDPREAADALFQRPPTEE